MNNLEVEKTVLNIDKDENIKNRPYYVEFKKSFAFDGKRYKGVDLTNICDLTAKDMIDAENYVKRMNIKSGFQSGEMIEQTSTYIFYMASRAAKLPLEFFYSLPASDAFIVKYKAMSFFLN